MGKVSYDAVSRYQKKAYTRISVLLRAGQKDVVSAHAAARGESLNAFINRAIAGQLARDAAAAGVPAPDFAPLGSSAPAAGDDPAADPAD